jgi:hypothetical protein
MINQNTKLADVLHLNMHLLSILRRLDIKLGFGKRPLPRFANSTILTRPFLLRLYDFS